MLIRNLRERNSLRALGISVSPVLPFPSSPVSVSPVPPFHPAPPCADFAASSGKYSLVQSGQSPCVNFASV